MAPRKLIQILAALCAGALAAAQGEPAAEDAAPSVLDASDVLTGDDDRRELFAPFIRRNPWGYYWLPVNQKFGVYGSDARKFGPPIFPYSFSGQGMILGSTFSSGEQVDEGFSMSGSSSGGGFFGAGPGFSGAGSAGGYGAYGGGAGYGIGGGPGTYSSGEGGAAWFEAMKAPPAPQAAEKKAPDSGDKKTQDGGEKKNEDGDGKARRLQVTGTGGGPPSNFFPFGNNENHGLFGFPFNVSRGVTLPAGLPTGVANGTQGLFGGNNPSGNLGYYGLFNPNIIAPQPGSPPIFAFGGTAGLPPSSSQHGGFNQYGHLGAPYSAYAPLGGPGGFGGGFGGLGGFGGGPSFGGPGFGPSSAAGGPSSAAGPFGPFGFGGGGPSSIGGPFSGPFGPGSSVGPVAPYYNSASWDTFPDWHYGAGFGYFGYPMHDLQYIKMYELPPNRWAPVVPKSSSDAEGADPAAADYPGESAGNEAPLIASSMDGV